jgi:hypothetical protein
MAWRRGWTSAGSIGRLEVKDDPGVGRSWAARPETWAGFSGNEGKQSGLSKDLARFVNTLQKNGFRIYFKVLDLKYQRFQTLSNQI